MRYLLDTHTFLWLAATPEHLSPRVSEIVTRRDNELFLSAANAWEVAILWNLGRIELTDAPARFVSAALWALGLTPLAIGVSTAIAAATLPPIHRDPFDRILIAEAQARDIPILSRDRIMADYGVTVLW